MICMDDLFISLLLHIMSTIIQYKYDKNLDQSFSQEEHEVKNSVSTDVSAMDMIGLTWIFQDDDWS